MEIDQRWIVEHGADRQHYIDQSQSINLFFRPDVNIKYLHAVHFQAWKSGLKTLYYCRSEKIGKSDKVSKKIERQVIDEIDLKALATEEICLKLVQIFYPLIGATGDETCRNAEILISS